MIVGGMGRERICWRGRLCSRKRICGGGKRVREGAIGVGWFLLLKTKSAGDGLL